MKLVEGRDHNSTSTDSKLVGTSKLKVVAGIVTGKELSMLMWNEISEEERKKWLEGLSIPWEILTEVASNLLSYVEEDDDRTDWCLARAAEAIFALEPRLSLLKKLAEIYALESEFFGQKPSPDVWSVHIMNAKKKLSIEDRTLIVELVGKL